MTSKTVKYSDIITFADDTSIFLQHENINMRYKIGHEELERIDQWLIANKLIIN